MSKAVIEGKISRSGANLTSASEDLLTASVFGPMRYLPAEDLLIPVLERARNLGGDPLTIQTTDDPTLKFWPRYKKSEPDVEIAFDDHLLFIEAKYLSGKSGDFDEESDETVHDQLAREFIDLQNLCGERRISLIFLTAHRVIPQESITNSIKASHQSETIDVEHFKRNTYWLSWFDIWKIVSGYETNDRYRKAILSDISSYLERLGLKHFTGFTKNDDMLVEAPGNKLFYNK